MRKNITVTLFTYSWPNSFEAKRTVQCRTRFGAMMTAKAILRPHEVETTKYCRARDTAKGAYCVVQSGGRKCTFVDAPVRIVPSVSELGWTP